MDTSREYIKMCDCPEIQEQWKPQLGDIFIPYKSHYGSANPRIIAHRSTMIDELGDLWEKSDARWLPRQDQLQEMIIDEDDVHRANSFNTFLYDAQQSFNHWFVCEQEPNYEESFEMLWLAFVMKKNFNKIYDSGDSGWKST